jgi:uncharacterized peroxidase-related enzyme
LLAAVKSKLGIVPGMMATWAHAPAALKAYLAMAEALGSGELSGGERELVALAAAEANQCEYCLAAHHVLGKGAGLSDASIAAARDGHGTTPREQAIAALARQIVQQRGLISDAEFAAAREVLGDAGRAGSDWQRGAEHLHQLHQPHRADGGGLPQGGAARAVETGGLRQVARAPAH